MTRPVAASKMLAAGARDQPTAALPLLRSSFSEAMIGTGDRIAYLRWGNLSNELNVTPSIPAPMESGAMMVQEIVTS
jgi:hypothetical protein